MKKLTTEQLIKSLDVHLDTSLTHPEIHVNDLTAYRDRLIRLNVPTIKYIGREINGRDELTEYKEALESIVNLSKFDEKIKATAAYMIAKQVCDFWKGI